MTKRIRKAVFPVGGLGTRFLPATKAMPKEMLPVVDKPLIQYAVEEAAAAGIEDFIFVTGRAKHAIEDHFDVSFELEYTLKQRGAGRGLQDVRDVRPANGRVAYTRQGEALGLGHAVLCARELVGDEPFAVLLADDLYPVRQALYATTGGSPRPDRRQRRRRDRGAARTDQPLRHPGYRRGGWRHGRGEGAGGKAGAARMRRPTCRSSGGIYCSPKSSGFLPRGKPARAVKSSLPTPWRA